MMRYAIALMFISLLGLSLAQVEQEGFNESLYAKSVPVAQDKTYKIASREDFQRLRSGDYQRDRYEDRSHQSEFARPYMYVDPAFPEYYSNFYDTDNSKFYFYYQNDNSDSFNESPTNYNNEPDYSSTDAMDSGHAGE